MVFWVIYKDANPRSGEQRCGPFESERSAKAALAALKARLIGTAASGFEVVVDYA